jgi:transketolase
VAIIDANGHQGLDREVPDDHWERFARRFDAAGWDVVEVDGHDHAALHDALLLRAERPLCVVARTVKGKGIGFMEGRFDSHYKSLRPSDRERAVAALEHGRLVA